MFGIRMLKAMLDKRETLLMFGFRLAGPVAGNI